MGLVLYNSLSALACFLAKSSPRHLVHLLLLCYSHKLDSSSTFTVPIVILRSDQPRCDLQQQAIKPCFQS